jgi:fatty acid desaturase
MTSIETHRTRRANRITAVLAVPAAIGCVAALVPAIEYAIGVWLLVLGLGGVLAVVGRFGARWLRERREDRADARTAAAWRAIHARHLLTNPPSGAARRAGVS